MISRKKGLSFSEIAALLGVPRKQVTAWHKAGMPAEKVNRSYLCDERLVAEWLVKSGHAEPIDDIVQSQAELAAVMDVHPKTVAEWTKHPTFPGQVGSAGRPGRYSVSQITAWREATHAGNVNQHVNTKNGNGQITQSSIHEERAKHEGVKREITTIDLMKLRLQLIETDYVGNLIIQEVNAIKEALYQLPGRVDSRLPSSVDAVVRRVLRDTTLELIHEIFDSIADLHDRIIVGTVPGVEGLPEQEDSVGLEA